MIVPLWLYLVIAGVVLGGLILLIAWLLNVDEEEGI